MQQIAVKRWSPALLSRKATSGGRQMASPSPDVVAPALDLERGLAAQDDEDLVAGQRVLGAGGAGLESDLPRRPRTASRGWGTRSR